MKARTHIVRNFKYGGFNMLWSVTLGTRDVPIL